MRFKDEVGQSLTLKFAESAARRRASGQSIISLGLGEPDFSTPISIIEATQRVLGEGVSGYSSPMGLPALREIIAEKLASENQVRCTADNILVAAGAKQAFQIVCMAMLEPGDEVVIIAPAFVSFVPQLYLSEPECVVKCIDISKNSFSAPLEQLEAAVNEKTKLIVINSPNNPAGYVFCPDEMSSIYQMARESDAYLISDEIYEKLNFSDEKMLSPGSLESSPERVITINGYSKSHAMTGWRLGYACIPDALKSRVLKIQQHMNTNTCTFVQKAVASVGRIDEGYLAQYREKLKKRSRMVVQWAESVDAISVVEPQAGFFAFLNISNSGVNSNDFCGRLIENMGVATTPGIAFGDKWDDHIRLSFAVPEATLVEGLGRITEFLESAAK
jgi:aspartate aminotransferase